MANNITAVANDVVRYFRRKSSTGFEPLTYFGAEQRYVTALSNSNINNLEEQFLLGTDTYIKTYTDNEGNQIIEKSFKKDTENDDKNYYKLISVIYSLENQKNSNFYFEGDTLTIYNKESDVSYDSQDKEFDFNNVDYVVFLEDEQNQEYLEIFPDTYTTMQIDTLYYIDKNKEEKLVARKITDKKISTDAKLTIRELIEKNNSNNNG